MEEFTPQPNYIPLEQGQLNITPGGGGSILNGGVFKSPNYVAGVAGWCIFSNGDVEFNDGTFRGTLTAGAISTATGFSLYPIWGSGSDGAVTYNGGGTSTLTQDPFATDLTISNNTTLDTGGYRIFCNGTCTIDSGSKISANGANGGNGGNATAVAFGAAGVAGAARTGNTVAGGVAGVNGGNGGSAPGAGGTAGVNGTAANPAYKNGVAGGNGGSAGSGTGGTAGAATAPKSRIRTTFEWESIRDLGHATLAQILGAAGSGGGGGGLGGPAGIDYAGGGGASGSTGGVICFIVKTLVLNGTVEAKGGNGGNGGTGNNNGAGGGGGGGGTGGLLVAVYGSKTGTGSFTVAGGTGGTGGAGGGGAGSNGTDGLVGTLIEIDL